MLFSLFLLKNIDYFIEEKFSIYFNRCVFIMSVCRFYHRLFMQSYVGISCKKKSSFALEGMRLFLVSPNYVYSMVLMDIFRSIH